MIQKRVELYITLSFLALDYRNNDNLLLLMFVPLLVPPSDSLKIYENMNKISDIEKE